MIEGRYATVNADTVDKKKAMKKHVFGFVMMDVSRKKKQTPAAVKGRRDAACQEKFGRKAPRLRRNERVHQSNPPHPVDD